MSYNVIGSKVRELRIAVGLSQADLVARCGVLEWSLTRGTMAKIESGNRAVNDAEVFLLARALRVPIETLYPRDADAVSKVARHADA